MKSTGGQGPVKSLTNLIWFSISKNHGAIPVLSKKQKNLNSIYHCFTKKSSDAIYSNICVSSCLFQASEMFSCVSTSDLDSQCL